MWFTPAMGTLDVIVGQLVHLRVVADHGERLTHPVWALTGHHVHAYTDIGTAAAAVANAAITATDANNSPDLPLHNSLTKAVADERFLVYFMLKSDEVGSIWVTLYRAD